MICAKRGNYNLAIFLLQTFFSPFSGILTRKNLKSWTWYFSNQSKQFSIDIRVSQMHYPKNLERQLNRLGLWFYKKRSHLVLYSVMNTLYYFHDIHVYKTKTKRYQLFSIFVRKLTNCPTMTFWWENIWIWLHQNYISCDAKPDLEFSAKRREMKFKEMWSLNCFLFI